MHRRIIPPSYPCPHDESWIWNEAVVAELKFYPGRTEENHEKYQRIAGAPIEF
jgi:hypothetical protein